VSAFHQLPVGALHTPWATFPILFPDSLNETKTKQNETKMKQNETK
jgi:hypothetical protein